MIGSIMRRDKGSAFKLRLRGKSYNEISRLLGVPKSTLSSWFTGLQLSEKARERIRQRVAQGTLQGLIRRNKNQTHLAIQRMRNTRAQARQQVRRVTRNELLLIGTALYWAEGYKRLAVRNGRELTHHAVALTNSDPKLVAIFLRFLREICAVSDKNIHADIRMYEHMNAQELLRFWQKVTRLPQTNFKKTSYDANHSDHFDVADVISKKVVFKPFDNNAITNRMHQFHGKCTLVTISVDEWLEEYPYTLAVAFTKIYFWLKKKIHSLKK